MEHIFNNVKNLHAKFFLPLQAIKEYLAKPENKRRVMLVREDKSECYVGTVGGINGTDSQNPQFTINIDESAPGGAELLKALKEGKSFACSICGDRLLKFPDIVTHCNIDRIELYPVKE